MIYLIAMLVPQNIPWPQVLCTMELQDVIIVEAVVQEHENFTVGNFCMTISGSILLINLNEQHD